VTVIHLELLCKIKIVLVSQLHYLGLQCKLVLYYYRPDVMLPGPLQCRKVYEEILVDIVSHLLHFTSMKD